MEISKQKLEKMMIKSFKEGQKAYKATDYPIKLYVRQEIQNDM